MNKLTVEIVSEDVWTGGSRYYAREVWEKEYSEKLSQNNIEEYIAEILDTILKYADLRMEERGDLEVLVHFDNNLIGRCDYTENGFLLCNMMGLGGMSSTYYMELDTGEIKGFGIDKNHPDGKRFVKLHTVRKAER